MNTLELQSRLKGRSTVESRAKVFESKIDGAKAVLGLSWFVALGRFCSFLTDFFKANGSYFFVLGLFVSYLGWVASAIELYGSANKNFGKIGNFAHNTFSFLFALAVIPVFYFAGKVLAGTIILISMAIDPLVNLGSAIYFGVRAALTADREASYFFKDRAIKHGFYSAIGIAVSVAFIALMFSALPVAVTIPLALLGMVVMIGSVSWVPRLVSKLLGPAPTVSASLTLDDGGEKRLLLLPQGGYYRNTITKSPISMQQLDVKIGEQIQKIERDCVRDEGSFLEMIWPQRAKRLKKIEALEFLKVLKGHVMSGREIPDQATEDKPFYLMGYHFHYADKAELCMKISEVVTARFPGAFQSVSAEIGDTQNCFNELFLSIIKKDQFSPVDEQDNLRSRHAF